MEFTTWGGLAAPKGTPRVAIDRLNAALAKAITAHAVRERYAQFNAEVIHTTPEAFGEHLRSEADRLKAIVDRAQIKID